MSKTTLTASESAVNPSSALISGLRDLAQFLENHPEITTPARCYCHTAFYSPSKEVVAAVFDAAPSAEVGNGFSGGIDITVHFGGAKLVLDLSRPQDYFDIEVVKTTVETKQYRLPNGDVVPAVQR